MSVAIRIIPCLDVKDGRVVKGVNFQGLQDAGDPVELAARYDAQGADAMSQPPTRGAPPCWTWSPAQPSRCSYP